jgi:hypothetical protein
LLAIRGERMRILDTIPRRGERVEYFAPAIGEDAADHAPPDTDLDGDGFSEVIVSEYTGGAHCCFNLHVVRLHPEPSYQRLSLQHAEGGVFEQLDGDPALEVVMPDWSMAYWNCGFANSPTPVVVLDLADGAWRPSVALMRRPPASDAELRKMAELWTGWRCDAGGLWGTGVCRGDLALPWESMLDLIYSGNAAQARWVLDHGCEETPEKRDAFWADMIQHLHRSDAWDTLVALNGNPLTG